MQLESLNVLKECPKNILVLSLHSNLDRPGMETQWDFLRKPGRKAAIWEMRCSSCKMVSVWGYDQFSEKTLIYFAYSKDYAGYCAGSDIYLLLVHTGSSYNSH